MNNIKVTDQMRLPVFSITDDYSAWLENPKLYFENRLNEMQGVFNLAYEQGFNDGVRHKTARNKLDK